MRAGLERPACAACSAATPAMCTASSTSSRWDRARARPSPRWEASCAERLRPSGVGGWRREARGTARLLMAYDEDLANRVRELLGDERGVSEMPMFGGLAFLL